MDASPVHLRSFVAVAEELHFGRAAQRLGIAQPAVSRHVRALEDALGAELMVRTSRETRLTDAGRAALASARAVLSELDAMQRAVDDADAGVRGRLRVAFVASTVSAWLPALVEALRDRAPLLELDVGQVRVAAADEELRRGHVDLVVARATGGEDLVAEPLGVEPTLAVLPPGHRLADREAIATAELAGDPLVLVDRRAWPDAYDAQLARLRELGLACDDVRHAGGPAESFALVAAGQGVMLRAASGVDAAADLACVPLSDQRSALFAIRRAGPAPASYELAISVLRDLVSDCA